MALGSGESGQIFEGQETQVRSGGRALERVPWEGLPETIQPLFGETKN